MISKESIRLNFLVSLDDNVSWKEPIKYLNKITKDIGLMYRAKPFLDK